MASCQTNEFKFIAIGDWGDEVKDQLPVAYAMARWADVNQPEFIISTGDNFYPDGVRSVTDPKWAINWVDVYNNDSLVNLPWYISVGNHDYGNDKGCVSLNLQSIHITVNEKHFYGILFNCSFVILFINQSLCKICAE